MVFVSRAEPFRGANRAVFAGINNGAFFGLVLLSWIHVQHGNFWKFSLGFGCLLLACAALAKRFLSDEPALKNSYLVQGLTLATVGFIAHFAGLRLALILAAEAAMLLYFANLRGNIFMRAIACICAGLSTAWVVFGLAPGATQEHWLLGAGVGALLFATAWWQHRSESDNELMVRPATTFLSILPLLVWAVTTWEHVQHGSSPRLRGGSSRLHALGSMAAYAGILRGRPGLPRGGAMRVAVRLAAKPGPSAVVERGCGDRGDRGTQPLVAAARVCPPGPRRSLFSCKCSMRRR